MPAKDLTIRAAWKEGTVETRLVIGEGVVPISLKDLTGRGIQSGSI